MRRDAQVDGQADEGRKEIMNIPKLVALWEETENHPAEVREILEQVCFFCDDIGGHRVDGGDLPFNIHAVAGMIFRLCSMALERMDSDPS